LQGDLLDVSGSSCGHFSSMSSNPSQDTVDDALCRPFAGKAVSTEELQGSLPPTQYCGALKDVYFRVVSPVGIFLHTRRTPFGLTLL
jgi:hypothetical protein